jgi:hypothetical protein
MNETKPSKSDMLHTYIKFFFQLFADGFSMPLLVGSCCVTFRNEKSDTAKKCVYECAL